MRSPHTIEPIQHFMDSKNVTRKTLAMLGTTSLARPQKVASHAMEACGGELMWFNYSRGAVLLWDNGRETVLELFDYQIDDESALEDLIHHKHPATFSLRQGKDDLLWNATVTPPNGDEDVLDEFKFLTDIFYMDAEEIHDMFFDYFFFDGGDIPNEFTPENVKKLVDSRMALAIH